MELQAQLRAGKITPHEAIQSRLQNGSLDIETARQCLMEHNVRDIYVKRKDRAKLQQSSGVIAGPILDWLWKDNTRWVTIICGQDLDFQEVLSYHLAREGLEQWMVKLLSTELPPHVTHLIPIDRRLAWRGLLFRSLIRGVAFVAPPNCADRPIDLYSQMADAKMAAKAVSRNFPRHPLLSLTLWPSMLLLRSILCYKRRYNTSPQKFERFMEAFQDSRARTEGDDYRLTLVELKLYHPTQPTADDVLSLCKEDEGYCNPGQMYREVQQAPRSGAQFQRMLRQGISVLRMQGRDSDAEWLCAYASQFLGMKEPHIRSSSKESKRSGFIAPINKVKIT